MLPRIHKVVIRFLYALGHLCVVLHYVPNGLTWSHKATFERVAINLVNVLVHVVFKKSCGLQRACQSVVAKIAHYRLGLRPPWIDVHGGQSTLADTVDVGVVLDEGLRMFSRTVILFVQFGLHLLSQKTWVSVWINVAYEAT